MNGTIDAIPEELRERDQWLLYSENSEPPKAPLNANGRLASWTDPAEWLSLDDARELVEESNEFDGIGFVFVESDPYIALDLDGCLRESREEKPKDWLPSIEPFTDTYMQYSTSGTGIHVFTKGDRLPEWWSNEHFSDEEHEGVEAYTKKFFVMTGDAVPSSHDEIVEVEIAPFLSEAYETITGEAPSLPGHGDTPDTDVDISVYDVISRTSFPEGENKSHPFHPSGTGTNFRVDPGGETFRCWRHGVTGNGAHLLGIDQGVIDCGDWDGTGLDTETWRDIFDAAREAGYDVPKPQASTDGGATTAQPATEIEPEPSASLSPLDVILEVVEDTEEAEETDLSDIDNDKIAFAVSTLLTRNDEYHVRWVCDNSTIYAYEDGVWKAIGDRKVREICHHALRNRNSQRIHGEVQHSIKSHPQLRIDRDELGAPEGTIAVENGLLNLRERTLRDIRPEDYTLNKIPTEFDQDAEYHGTEWLEFLDASVRPKDVDKLQEYAGYLLWHHAQPFGKAMFLIGPTDSGKGTFLEVIESVIGPENAASQSLFELMQSRWGMAELYGKMANIRNEVTGGGLKNVQRFKELTGGGDRVSAERKGQDPFKFKVKQKFLFATNQVPSVEHAGEPFFNRLLFAKFPNTVPEEEQDEELADRLKDESPAILNWMLDGLNRLLDQGGFSSESSIDDKREIADSFGNLVDRFAHNLLDVTGDPDDKVHKGQLYDLFTEYAEHIGKNETPPQQTFTRDLKGKNGVSDSQTRRVNDPETNKPHVFTGVRVIEEYVDEFGGTLANHSYSDESAGEPTQQSF